MVWNEMHEKPLRLCGGGERESRNSTIYRKDTVAFAEWPSKQIWY